MHMPAHLAVMLKESRFFPNEEYRLVADAQHGFDEDNDQTGLTYQLLKKFNIWGAFYTFSEEIFLQTRFLNV